MERTSHTDNGTLLYVTRQEDFPTPVIPWLPPRYPALADRVVDLDGKRTPPPLWKHEIMTQEEMELEQRKYRLEFLTACHENGALAKDPRQLEIAMVHPKTTPEMVAQWIDASGAPRLHLYNTWVHRHAAPPAILPRFVPLEQFIELQKQFADMNEHLRSRGLK